MTKIELFYLSINKLLIKTKDEKNEKIIIIQLIKMIIRKVTL